MGILQVLCWGSQIKIKLSPTFISYKLFWIEACKPQSLVSCMYVCMYMKQCFQYCILYVPALSHLLSNALNFPTPSSWHIKHWEILTCSHALCDTPLHILCSSRGTRVSHMSDTQRYPKTKSLAQICHYTNVTSIKSLSLHQQEALSFNQISQLAARKAKLHPITFHGILKEPHLFKCFLWVLSK